MSRNLNGALVTAAESKVFSPAWFVYLDWPTGAVRVWAGYGEIAWGGFTWLGLGTLGKIGSISESSDLSANSVTLEISGENTGEISQALDGTAQGRDGIIYLSSLTSAGALVATPTAVFAGFINYTQIVDDGSNATITVTLSKDFTQRDTQPRRNTNEDQQIDHPSDLFFEYLAANCSKEFSWGHVVVPTAADNSGDPDSTNLYQ